MFHDAVNSGNHLQICDVHPDKGNFGPSPARRNCKSIVAKDEANAQKLHSLSALMTKRQILPSHTTLQVFAPAAGWSLPLSAHFPHFCCFSIVKYVRIAVCDHRLSGPVQSGPVLQRKRDDMLHRLWQHSCTLRLRALALLLTREMPLKVRVTRCPSR